MLFRSFCRLLRPTQLEQGVFEIGLRDMVSSTQDYITTTAVLVTTLTDSRGGAVRIPDFAPRFKQYDRIYRPAMLIRRIEPIAGTPANRIPLRPLFGYGGLLPSRTLARHHTPFTAPAELGRAPGQ